MWRSSLPLRDPLPRWPRSAGRGHYPDVENPHPWSDLVAATRKECGVQAVRMGLDSNTGGGPLFRGIAHVNIESYLMGGIGSGRGISEQIECDQPITQFFVSPSTLSVLSPHLLSRVPRGTAQSADCCSGAPRLCVALRFCYLSRSSRYSRPSRHIYSAHFSTITSR